MTRRMLLTLLLSLAVCSPLLAQMREQDLVKNAGAVLTEITRVPERGLPTALLQEAQAIMIFPDVVKAGFIVGGPVYTTGGSQWSRDELERRIAELGLSGRVGLIDFQTDTAPVYRALDIVVHASTEPEPFGLVIAEAMTCGRAVVVSGAGGAKEIGQPGHSLMTHRPGDAADLARVLGMLAGDATLRACLGTTAAAHSRATLSLGLMGERVDAVYAQVLS